MALEAMAETLTTPDGQLHTLIGSTTLESLVRKYAGDQAADLVQEALKRNAYDEARAETDLGSYEASLEHWRQTVQDWVDETEVVTTGEHTKRELLIYLQELLRDMKTEL